MKLREFTDKYMLTESWYIHAEPKDKDKCSPVAKIDGNEEDGYEIEIEDGSNLTLKEIKDLAMEMLTWVENMNKEIVLR